MTVLLEHILTTYDEKIDYVTVDTTRPTGLLKKLVRALKMLFENVKIRKVCDGMYLIEAEIDNYRVVIGVEVYESHIKLIFDRKVQVNTGIPDILS